MIKSVPPPAVQNIQRMSPTLKTPQKPLTSPNCQALSHWYQSYAVHWRRGVEEEGQVKYPLSQQEQSCSRFIDAYKRSGHERFSGRSAMSLCYVRRSHKYDGVSSASGYVARLTACVSKDREVQLGTAVAVGCIRSACCIATHPVVHRWRS
jgi:hypothetical protein